MTCWDKPWATKPSDPALVSLDSYRLMDMVSLYRKQAKDSSRMLPKSITCIWNNMTVSKRWQKLHFWLSLSSNKISESLRDWTDTLDKYTRMILKDCLMSRQICPSFCHSLSSTHLFCSAKSKCALTRSLGKTQQTLSVTSSGSHSLSCSLSLMHVFGLQWHFLCVGIW